jgi:hypothetical protein
MLDKVVKEKFLENPNFAAVRNQTATFAKMFRASTNHEQTIVDVLYASRLAHRESKEGIAELGFVMGMQFGFELALSFPPLTKK